MFGNKKIDNITTNTIIGEGITIEGGMIRGSGGVRIDGQFIGDIDIDGNIIVGESGSIKGNVSVKHILIAGSIDGSIKCSAGIHLSSNGKLSGNIDTASLVIDEGALFIGNSQMSGHTYTPIKGTKDLVYNDKKSDVI